MYGKLAIGRIASRLLDLIILAISILIVLSYFIPTWIADKITSESTYNIIYVLCDTMVCLSIPCVIFLLVYIFKRTRIKKHIALKKYSVFLRVVMLLIAIGLYATSYVIPYFEEIIAEVISELPIDCLSSILEMVVSLQEVYKEVAIILAVSFVVILIISRMGKHYYEYTKSMAIEYERINSSSQFTYSEKNLHTKEVLKAYRKLDESFKITITRPTQSTPHSTTSQLLPSSHYTNRSYHNDYSTEGSAIGILAIICAIFCTPLGLLLAIIGLCIYKNPVNRKRCKIAIFIVIIMIIISFVFGLSILSWILGMLETY